MTIVSVHPLAVLMFGVGAVILAIVTLDSLLRRLSRYLWYKDYDRLSNFLQVNSHLIALLIFLFGGGAVIALL
ncbi:hypothetical protein EVB87_196 [Rhizobium phage RHph_N28_1]|nr:hypothetical protein EVB87_196 [Rhizobium phage RHph_N28_1]QIG74225.1 hypothetical protein EVC07_197 [Rhizobium phage RHph_N42]QXV73885.1 hypothetical protein [Rhizobium phage RHph_N46]